MKMLFQLHPQLPNWKTIKAKKKKKAIVFSYTQKENVPLIMTFLVIFYILHLVSANRSKQNINSLYT